MLKNIERFEYVINVALLVMLSLIVVLATIALGWIIVKDVLKPPVFLLNIDELLELLNAFLLILIAVELLHTVKSYLMENTIHVEVILAVGIIAIARKVIILEPKKMDGLSLLGIAAIIFALTAGYYFVKIGEADQKKHRPLTDRPSQEKGAD